MAGDLIPPPSPAGAPVPDARDEAAERGLSDDVLLGLPPDPDAADAEPEVEPAAQSRYRSRFGFITGALIGTALAALVIVVLVASSPSKGEESGDSWSVWRPTATEPYSALAQIAQHVALNYRLDDGTQIVSVQSGPIELNDVPLEVVVRTAPTGGDIFPITGDSVWFVLNGLGERGSIASGKPSNERGALVRREALELALYTFHYIKEIDNVVVLLPPLPPSKSGTAGGATSTSSDLSALLFRPGDLQAQLKLPLALTLSPHTPRPSTISERDQQMLSDFLAQNIFNAEVRTSQTGAGFLVLTHPQTAVTSAPLGATGPTGPTGPTGKRLTSKKPRSRGNG